jgi:hypothetical protein
MSAKTAERITLGWFLSATLCAGAMAEPIPVKKMEGVVHGFLVLRSLGGKVLAEGDLVQVPQRGRIESRLTFRFRDGSIQDSFIIAVTPPALSTSGRRSRR